MFVYPIFWGCKYTNNFLFINKKPEFQQFKLLITSTESPDNEADTSLSGRFYATIYIIGLFVILFPLGDASATIEETHCGFVGS